MKFLFEKLEQVEEIYLDQRQFSCWMDRDSECNHFFTLLVEKVELKDIDSTSQCWEFLGNRKLRQMVLRAYGPQKNSLSQAKPAPKPARKLKRQKGDVWTLFYYRGYIICVHDDGTVVSRFNRDCYNHHEYRFTPDGLIFRHLRRPFGEVLVESTEEFFDTLLMAFEEWTKLGKGRKMPISIQRIIERMG
jgi:hypothetical protein